MRLASKEVLLIGLAVFVGLGVFTWFSYSSKSQESSAVEQEAEAQDPQEKNKAEEIDPKSMELDHSVSLASVEGVYLMEGTSLVNYGCSDGDTEVEPNERDDVEESDIDGMPADQNLKDSMGESGSRKKLPPCPMEIATEDKLILSQTALKNESGEETFAESKADQPEASLEVSGGGDHMCSIQGSLAQKAPGVLKISSSSEGSLCEVLLYFSKEDIGIESEGDCSNYCGARAIFSGKFTRAKRKSYEEYLKTRPPQGL